MELTQYQLVAQRTALETALDRKYLVPMIISEIGELFGQEAKAVRDGWTPERLQKELISEYGDIAWGTAILQRLLGVYGDDEGFQYATHPDPKAALLSQSLGLYMADTDDEQAPWLDDAAESLWFTLKHHCEAITGVSFDEVLGFNVAKLKDRAERNVLSGAGDHR